MAVDEAQPLVCPVLLVTPRWRLRWNYCSNFSWTEPGVDYFRVKKLKFVKQRLGVKNRDGEEAYIGELIEENTERRNLK